MACAQKSAVEYLRKCRRDLVTGMQNLPLITENLYQQKVFNVHEVDALKAEETEFDKARSILDWVIKKGEEASYELLSILDFTRKRTLQVDLHVWICCFSFREDADASYSFGTKPCQNYQMELKTKAKRILKNQWQQSCKYLHNKSQTNFIYIPLVLETGSVVKTAHSKIKKKCKKFRKLRPKKLRSYIPDKQETLSPEDLLKWKTRNILLIGKPGIGKTTVVQQMLKMWTEKDDKQPDYVFYFDETAVSCVSNLVNLESCLFDGYLKPKEEDRREVFEDIEENSENVVIVFDGVTSVQEHSILQKIMDHDLLPDAKVIITCRTEVEDDVISDWPSQKVYVQGFSEESIRIYYQMMLGHNPDLLYVVLINQELFSLSHVPMYAFMIVAFIPFKNDTVTNQSNTVTEMYIHIFRDALKKCGRKKTGQIDRYLREVKDQLYLLMKNAFSATEQKSLNLPEISGDETDICHAFLKMITIRDSLTSETKYCAFLHNTMQEFFSALWLVENPDEIEKVLKLCQTEEIQHMRHVLPFLCGLLGEHNNKLLKCLFSEDQMKKTSERFTEKLLDTFLKPQSDGEDVDLLYVCQCLYELQSSNACLMFLEKMKHQLDIDVNLDPHQSCALSYVISQSRDKEVHLNLQDCTVSDTGMIMILSCSPQIRIKVWDEPLQQIKFLLESCHKVSKNYETMTSCCWTSDKPDLTQALLDLCSHVKDYETQSGRSLLPALQSVYQTPDVWIIDLSQRKTSILLEVLKLQTEKKPVELRGWTDEESEVMSFLQCLPYISQLGLEVSHVHDVNRFLLRLYIKAAETETQTGDQMMKLLTSVCTYTTFPYEEFDDTEQSDFLLDLYSHVKDYETQSGRSLLPALQSVYQTPDVWIIDLSERKTSILLEVLKLQTEKKPVELRGWSDEESEVMSFLQCLPYISQLR
ncbi:protein NLRC5-like [Triplophysa rosa]|uniref:protein NLRC5-like n=1 Tax=Triplophysa rosa TaxID=992332 RepID=UPI002546058C|nr:protein NLRC5-like [Triplophysa rosa]